MGMDGEQIFKLAEMVKLMALIRDNGVDSLIRDWKSFVDFLYAKYNNRWLSEGFAD